MNAFHFRVAHAREAEVRLDPRRSVAVVDPPVGVLPAHGHVSIGRRVSCGVKRDGVRLAVLLVEDPAGVDQPEDLRPERRFLELGPALLRVPVGCAVFRVLMQLQANISKMIAVYHGQRGGVGSGVGLI